MNITFNLETLREVQKSIPQLEHKELFVRPDINTRLAAELKATTAEFLGLSVFVKHDQKMPCWAITDEKLAKAYRDGFITEDQLIWICTHIPDKACSLKN